MFDEQVNEVLGEICLEIEKGYEIKLIKSGVDKDHVHFLVQSTPRSSVRKLVAMIQESDSKRSV